jgi:hypothetical protein
LQPTLGAQQDCRREAKSYCIDKRYVRDGGIVWANLTNRLRAEDGRRRRLFRLRNSDITDRKRAQARLADHQCATRSRWKIAHWQRSV